MSYLDPTIEIINQFIELIEIFQAKYVDKKEINTNLYKIFEKIKESSDELLNVINEHCTEFESRLTKKLEILEEIESHKETINNLDKKMKNCNFDDDDFLNIDDEIKSLREKITSLNEFEVVKERDLIEKNIFDCKENLIFFDNIMLFSKLLISLIKIYDENIKEDDFDEISKDLADSDSVALKNMMNIIKYKYYKGMQCEDYIINEFFSIQQFYTLLSLSNNSLKLIDYGVDQLDEKDLEKHFNLLKIQNLVLLVLASLCVRHNDQERKVAHYTNLEVGLKLAKNISYVRLNSVDFMNDPMEGKILKDFLNLKSIHDNNIHINTFLTCFTFNHNSLNQFRLYGNTDDIECSGLSLVFEDLFFAQGFEKVTSSRVYYKLPIFRCLYLDYFTGYFEIARRNKFTFYQEYKDKKNAETSWSDYINKINKIEKKIKKYFDEMKILIEVLYKINDLQVIYLINNLVNPLRFLIKHFAFQEEQECRMMRIENIENSEVIFDVENNKSYIDYKLDANKYLSNIYIGEKCKLNYTYLIKEIKKTNGRLPKIRVTDNPFRSEKKDFMYKK